MSDPVTPDPTVRTPAPPLSISPGTAPTTSPAPSPESPAAAARLAGRLALGDDGHDAGAAVTKVPTGIGGFDHVAMGGLPLRRTTVLAGPAGAAKTIFAAQFLAEGVRRGDAGVFVTLEEPAADLRANFATLGWDVPAWEAAGDWRFVDGSPLTRSGGSEETVFDVATLVAQIGAAVDRTGARRLALDSISAVLSLQGDAVSTRQLLRSLVLSLRGMDLTTVLTIETEDEPVGSLTRYGVEEFVADNVVLLRNIREATFRRRTLEVLKMRGAMHHKGDVPFTIIPGEGLRVLPVTSPAAGSTPAPAQPRDRVSTGVTGLDEMTRGGLFRASTTMVVGTTGTGKTMVSTRFAAEGVDRGERVLVVAYEESREQVLTNAAALGFDFARSEAEGGLSIQSFHPEVASLDDHLVHLQELVDRLRPSRVVLDGLSALERLGSPLSYRGFLIGVTSSVRDAGTATVVTATPPAPQETSTTREHLTGLVDTILVLRHQENGSVLRRGVHVQRMRGSHHDTSVRELLIDESGISVGGLLPAP